MLFEHLFLGRAPPEMQNSENSPLLSNNNSETRIDNHRQIPSTNNDDGTTTESMPSLRYTSDSSEVDVENQNRLRDDTENNTLRDEDAGNNGTAETTNDNDTNNTASNQPYNDFLTRTRLRLRCLFIFFTCPIIPLVSALTIFLVWVLYAAFFGEDGGDCSEPLRTYAVLSACLFVYTPNHKRVKRLLRMRRRNTNDAAIDRMYDHLYLTTFLFYIYLGVTWTENCRGGCTSHAADAECYACGCPRLYHATRSFVLTLCVLATVLALPLLCLPCVYLWIVRGATEDALEAAARDLDGTSSELSRWTVDEVLDRMERVCLNTVKTGGNRSAVPVSMDHAHPQPQPASPSTTSSLEHSQHGASESRLLTDDISMGDGTNPYLPPLNEHGDLSQQDNDTRCKEDTQSSSAEGDAQKECCICMNDFNFEGGEDGEAIVKTKCGHLFHRSCLAGWLGGHWITEGSSDTRVTRRVCPLCRMDLLPAEEEEDEEDDNNIENDQSSQNNSSGTASLNQGEGNNQESRYPHRQ